MTALLSPHSSIAILGAGLMGRLLAAALARQGHAVEVYEATSPLAQRIGQSDIEIGALAGIGICFLELGRFDAARRTLDALQLRMQASG